MPKLSPAEKEKRREHLLQAALRAFARSGYSRTTIEHVALEAGVSKGTPYVYFASKEVLFRALFERWECGLSERIDVALAAMPTEERRSPRHTLRAILIAVGDQVTAESDACRVLLEAQAQAHYLPGVAETVNASQARSLASFEQLFRAGAAAGECPVETDPALLAQLLLAALLGLMGQWHLQPGGFSWPKAACTLADQFMASVDRTTERSIVA